MHETALHSILSGAFNESFEQDFPPLITPRNPEIPAFRMVYLPGGMFTMGDDNGQYDREKPAHKVELSPFYMAEYQVTQELYLAVTGTNPSRFQNLKKPVESVTWYNAADFCNLLSAKLGLQEVYKKTGDDKYEWNNAATGFRLPTEAEWEFAAGLRLRSVPGIPEKNFEKPVPERSRRNDQFLYSGSNNLNHVSWYSENSHGSSKKSGLKFPNAAGLYDMSGNLWEWCWDWYDEKYYQKCKNEGIIKNPRGQQSGNSRVLRGGSWGSETVICRVAGRSINDPHREGHGGGFRLCLACSSPF